MFLSKVVLDSIVFALGKRGSSCPILDVPPELLAFPALGRERIVSSLVVFLDPREDRPGMGGGLGERLALLG